MKSVPLAKRSDKIDVIKKFLEKKGLPKELWYELCDFVEFEYKYSVTIHKRIKEETQEINNLKQQSREMGAKLSKMRNNGNKDGWLYELIKDEHNRVILKLHNCIDYRKKLLKMLEDMQEDAETTYYRDYYI